MDILVLEMAGSGLAGIAIGYGIWRWRDRNLRSAISLKEQTILENARRDAENIAREARLAANEETLKIREETERKFGERRQILAE